MSTKYFHQKGSSLLNWYTHWNSKNNQVKILVILFKIKDVYDIDTDVVSLPLHNLEARVRVVFSPAKYK